MSNSRTSRTRNRRSDASANWTKLISWMFQPVAIDWLVVYRISFGLVMFWYATKYLWTGLVDHFYFWPIFHFPYDGFEWVSKSTFALQFGETIIEAIHIEFVSMAILALMIAAGAFFRVSSVLFALLFTHIFLIDKCYYQNHYYLVAILSCQLPFLPAERAFSFDSWRRPEIRCESAPRWSLWLIRFQIAVPYFYGGIAKFGADWLRGQPMRLALADKVDRPIIGGPWFAEEWFVQLFVWGGLLFDLLIVPALLCKKTRLWAFLACLIFHVMNSLTWTIGIFPWLMILATTVYFEPDWPRRLRARLFSKQEQFVSTGKHSFSLDKQPVTFPKLAGITLLTLFVTWQVLFPFRHFVLPGESNWDEYSHYFSWHMLLRAKECGLRVTANDGRTGKSGNIDLRTYLTARQLGVVARDPRLIQRLCHYIKADLESKGHEQVEVRVQALISLNGRKPQLIIDPQLDLASVPLSWSYPDFVLPLQEPFRHQAWNVPLDQWEEHLDAGGAPSTVSTSQPDNFR